MLRDTVLSRRRIPPATRRGKLAILPDEAGSFIPNFLTESQILVGLMRSDGFESKVHHAGDQHGSDFFTAGRWLTTSRQHV